VIMHEAMCSYYDKLVHVQTDVHLPQPALSFIFASPCYAMSPEASPLSSRARKITPQF
jgi:hypothetical protein